jgi:hypothetical protein
MRFHVLTSLLALASTTSAAITWTLQKAANPTTDQADAYSKIEAAMRLAVARYARFSDASKRLTIQYEVSTCWLASSYAAPRTTAPRMSCFCRPGGIMLREPNKTALEGVFYLPAFASTRPCGWPLIPPV